MPWVGFEPTIPMFEQAKTVHALDRAVTVVGYSSSTAEVKLKVEKDNNEWQMYSNRERDECDLFQASILVVAGRHRRKPWNMSIRVAANSVEIRNGN
jgi:hypothetical protein